MSDYSMQAYSPEAVVAEVKKMLAAQKIPNILICGQTGVGKSSVVNYLFNDTVATVDTVEPCTEGIRFYPSQTIGIYDSEGYEIGSKKQSRYEKLIFDFLSTHKEANDKKAAHLIWYAINGAGKRYTDLDITLIKRIKSEGFPVAVLLTKIDELDEDQLRGMLDKLNQELPNEKIFKLSIKAKTDSGIAKFCDWEKLTNWSCDNLADVFRDRFVAALRTGLEQKMAQAEAAIKSVGWKGGLAGALSGELAPTQTAMIIEIATIFGVDLGEDAIKSSIQKIAEGTTAVGSGIGGLVNDIAHSLSETSPHLAQIIGNLGNAVVKGGTAGSVTYALGTAFANLCYRQAQGSLDGKKLTLDIATVIKSAEFIADVVDCVKKKKTGEREYNTEIVKNENVGENETNGGLLGKIIDTAKGGLNFIKSCADEAVEQTIYAFRNLAEEKLNDWIKKRKENLRLTFYFDVVVFLAILVVWLLKPGAPLKPAAWTMTLLSLVLVGRYAWTIYGFWNAAKTIRKGYRWWKKNDEYQPSILNFKSRLLKFRAIKPALKESLLDLYDEKVHKKLPDWAQYAAELTGILPYVEKVATDVSEEVSKLFREYFWKLVFTAVTCIGFYGAVIYVIKYYLLKHATDKTTMQILFPFLF